MKASEHIADRVEVVDEDALGHLDREPVGRDAGVGDCVHHRLHDADRAQLLHRHVYRHTELGELRMGVGQGGEVACMRGRGPTRSISTISPVSSARDELLRAHQSSLRMVPADQRFGADDLVDGQPDDRLVAKRTRSARAHEVQVR